MSYINFANKLHDLSRPLVMGIINITPDSFFAGSRYQASGTIIDIAGRMIDSGVDIIDIGGYSSRPAANEISAKEEEKRLRIALEIIRSVYSGIIISVDTFRSDIARMAVNEYGVGMINDISGGEGDESMIKTVARLDVPYVMMHMQGVPSNMQDNPQYADVVNDIILWFSERLLRFREAGIKDIIIDPGFGFGKTSDHNFAILNSLERFSILECPIMVGLSRKSMIWKTLGSQPESLSSLTGTVVLNTIALMKGASLIRVHDVEEAVHTIKLLQRVTGME